MPTAPNNPLPLYLRPTAQAVKDLADIGHAALMIHPSGLTAQQIQDVRDCLTLASDPSVIRAAIEATTYHTAKIDFFSELQTVASSSSLPLQCAAIKALWNTDDLTPFAPMIAKHAAPGNRVELRRACAQTLASHYSHTPKRKTDATLFTGVILELLKSNDDPTITSALGAITRKNFIPFITDIITCAADHSRPDLACAAFEAMKYAPNLMVFYNPICDALQQTAIPRIARSAIRVIDWNAHYTNKIPPAFIPVVSAATNYPEDSIQTLAFSTIGRSHEKKPFFALLTRAAENFATDPKKAALALSAMSSSDETYLFMPTIKRCVQGPDDIALEALKVIDYTLLYKQGLSDLDVATILGLGLQHPSEMVICKTLDIINYRAPATIIPQFLSTVQAFAKDPRPDVANAATQLLSYHQKTHQPTQQPQLVAPITPEPAPPPAQIFSGIVLNFNIPENGPGCGPDFALQDSSAALATAFNQLQGQDPNATTMTCYAGVYYNNNKPLDEGTVLHVTVDKATLPDIVTHACQGTSPSCKVEMLPGHTPEGHKKARLVSLSAPLRS